MNSITQSSKWVPTESSHGGRTVWDIIELAVLDLAIEGGGSSFHVAAVVGERAVHLRDWAGHIENPQEVRKHPRPAKAIRCRRATALSARSRLINRTTD